MSTGLVSLAFKAPEWIPLSSGVTIGKDILELLSSSMYIDPMTIYREYIQNAADSIDACRQMHPELVAQGKVDILIDSDARIVKITDNGAGIPSEEFSERLLAFGASSKRGTHARGFRGVGRLAGIGYCQELIFRSRAIGETAVSELRWDCRKLKSILRAAHSKDDLTSAVMQVVSVRSLRTETYKEKCFFEVELRGIVRHRNDQLLSESAVGSYLAQVGPVPFEEDFKFRDKVLAHIGQLVRLGDLEISINNGRPLRRPFQTDLSTSDSDEETISDVELVTIPSVDGEAVAAVGWVAHHSYGGALPSSLGVRGMRVRVGNIQVGDERLLEEIFPEPRFNIWSIAEIHVIDSRVVPNGRRDHFDQNVHYNNLLTHLLPTARDVARRCRMSSIHRKWVRDFEVRESKVREDLAILRQGAIGKRESSRLQTQIEDGLSRIRQVAEGGVLPLETSLALREKVETLSREVRKKLKVGSVRSPLEVLAPQKRRAFEEVIGLIYECSANRTAAKSLVDKIIEKVR